MSNFTGLKNFLAWLLPANCSLCQQQVQGDYDLCPECEQSLTFLTHTCSQCALPLSEAEDLICKQCLNQPPVITACHALFAYTSPINHLILGLKFHHQLHYAKLLGTLFAKHFEEKFKLENNFPACIIPVPLHRQRLKERGYNQALEIAKVIAKHFGLKIDNQACERTKPTVAQMLLDAEQRQINLAQAFRTTKPLTYPTVAIFDDVITTGATVNELANTLLNAGVKQVMVWSIARTLNPLNIDS